MHIYGLCLNPSWRWTHIALLWKMKVVRFCGFDFYSVACSVNAYYKFSSVILFLNFCFGLCHCLCLHYCVVLQCILHINTMTKSNNNELLVDNNNFASRRILMREMNIIVNKVLCDEFRTNGNSASKKKTLFGLTASVGANWNVTKKSTWNCGILKGKSEWKWPKYLKNYLKRFNFFSFVPLLNEIQSFRPFNLLEVWL